jgi:hypothetical protein
MFALLSPITPMKNSADTVVKHGRIALVSRESTEGTNAMSKSAFTYLGTKEAALYFDEVIPLFLLYDAAFEYDFDELMAFERPSVIERVLKKRNSFVKLLPPELSEGTRNFEHYVELNSKIIREFDFGSDDFEPKFKDRPVTDLFQVNKEAINKAIGEFILKTSFPNAAFSTVETALSSQDSHSDSDIAVTLLGLNLVDASSASIEQIIDFREDRHSMAALRQLRLFSEENYSGKSIAFIEDDLLHRLYGYDEAAKKWGFETIHAGLATLFNSKTALGTLGGTFAAVLAGSPVLASSAALVGTSLEIGKISLAVTRKKFDGRAALKDNPVSYIATAKELLE